MALYAKAVISPEEYTTVNAQGKDPPTLHNKQFWLSILSLKLNVLVSALNWPCTVAASQILPYPITLCSSCKGTDS